MKKAYLKKFWNGFHLEEEEKEDFEIQLTTGMKEKGINNMKWIDRDEWRRKMKLYA